MKEEQESIADQLENFIETNKEILALKLTDKIANIVSSLVSRLAIALLALMVVFLLTMGLSLWIGDLVGKDFAGYLIVGGFIALVTIFIYRKRETMIKKPVMDTIISQILKQ